jgi:putative Ca2+/H+ antiporter (TMEM165/GDT1 family)
MTVFFTVFITIFLAELGDKTQLATLLYASDAERPRLVVFAAAAAALIASTALAVALGAAVERFLPMLPLKLLAGAGFIIVGGLLVFEHLARAG